MVDKHVAFQMVELMLHDAGQIAFYPFVVLFEVLVLPLYPYSRGTYHLLVDGRQRQATLFR